MFGLRMKPLLVAFLLCAGVGLVFGEDGASAGEEASGGSGGSETVKNPLPAHFTDHTQPQNPSQGGANTIPVEKDHVVRMLIRGLKGAEDSPGECDRKGAVKELEDSATKALGSIDKARRLVRAIAEKLNATCDEIKSVSSHLKNTEDATTANKLRRAVEDSAVLGGQGASQNPSINRIVQFQLFRGGPGAELTGGRIPTLLGGGGFNPFIIGGNNPRFGGGFEDHPFRFGMSGNPFFNEPLTAPALDMDLDRLLFLSTPVLGMVRAFTLTKALHDLQSPRSEVFQVQEEFQNKNLTQAEAIQILSNYETKLKASSAPTAATPDSVAPTTILQNTAELAGMNATESKRFARAISQTIGSTLNSTQALEIHHAVRDLDSNQLGELTDDIEKIAQGTTTPDGAIGHDWIFSNKEFNDSNGVGDGKRSVLNTLDSSTRMFSSERACGFSIETDRGVVYPWVATLSCNRVQCTGSLISSSVILTSASCILSCGNDAVRVTLGDTRVTKILELQAEAAVVQPGFSSSRDPQFDVGLVRLTTPIDFNLNPLIYPICLLGVETDDPTIECEVIVAGGQRQPIHQGQLQKSVVSCFQPGNQICSSNGILQNIACVRLNNCIPVSSQPSVPVICRRMNQIPARYYQWGVTTSDHNSLGGGVCFNGVARISDSISFLSNGLA